MAPDSQSVPPGANVTFSVAAADPLSITYRWTFNGTNIAGATNSVYTINNAQASAAGTYTVIVSDSGGGSVRLSATLSVGSFDVWVSEPVGNYNIP